jgi:hypothetical protein
VKPRGWLESFLLLAAPGGIAFALGWKLLTGESTQASTTIGILFGIVIGLISASKITEAALSFPIPDRTQFLTSLNTRLAELDIYPSTDLESFKVYESKSAGSFSLGPVSLNGFVQRVRVKLEGGTVTVVASRQLIKELGLRGYDSAVN